MHKKSGSHLQNLRARFTHMCVYLLHYLNDRFKMDHINYNDKTYEKCEYFNKNLNELGMNDANKAYKNRIYIKYTLI